MIHTEFSVGLKLLPIEPEFSEQQNPGGQQRVVHSRNLKPTTKCRVSGSPFSNILHYWEQGNLL